MNCGGPLWNAAPLTFYRHPRMVVYVVRAAFASISCNMLLHMFLLSMGPTACSRLYHSFTRKGCCQQDRHMGKPFTVGGKLPPIAHLQHSHLFYRSVRTWEGWDRSMHGQGWQRAPLTTPPALHLSQPTSVRAAFCTRLCAAHLPT